MQDLREELQSISSIISDLIERVEKNEAEIRYLRWKNVKPEGILSSIKEYINGEEK